MRPAITAMVVVLATACMLRAADPPPESSSESDRASPHEAVSIHVFVTPEGESPLRAGTAGYPVGTIPLKQKLVGGNSRRNAGVSQPTTHLTSGSPSDSNVM